tara:strand:- start:333 stop:824 length:492 start_codon:yes stop_codon:yes gene_type:complete
MHSIKNLLPEERRKKLIEDLKPLLVSSLEMGFFYGGKFAGKQTHATLYELPVFRSLMDEILEVIKEKTQLDLVVDKAWANWTNGDSNDIGWHSHTDVDYASVYYIKTSFLNNGTMFKDGFVKAPQNSLLVFPSHLEHTAPTYRRNNPFRFDRYTMSMDLNIRT